MWTKSFSKVYSGVSKEEIWRLWIDVNNWPKWAAHLESCELKQSFTVGNTFTLTPIGKSPVVVTITEVVDGRKFTDCTYFPTGAQMFDTHELEETPAGLKLTNTLQVSGFLEWLWVWLVAQKVFETTEVKMDALVELAKSQEQM